MKKGGGKTIKIKEKVNLIVKAAEEKNANNLVIINMRPVANITDYFVICSGTSNMQIRAIVDNIRQTLDREKENPLNIEADPYPKWVLMDYGDVICHIFEEETRRFYDLEHLWADAPRVNADKV